MVRERTSGPLAEARALLRRQLVDIDDQIKSGQAAVLRLQTERAVLEGELRGLDRGAGLRRTKQKRAAE